MILRLRKCYAHPVNIISTHKILQVPTSTSEGEMPLMYRKCYFH